MGFAVSLIPGAVRVQKSFAATGFVRRVPVLSFYKTDSKPPLIVASQFTSGSGQFRGKVENSKPSWQFSGITVSKKLSKEPPTMQRAKYFPVSDFKIPKGPGGLNRLTDNLVARLRDVQTALAECQPAYESEKRTGS